MHRVPISRVFSGCGEKGAGLTRNPKSGDQAGMARRRDHGRIVSLAA